MRSNGISFQFQFLTLSITTLIIVIYLVGELRVFCSIDTPPKIHTLVSPVTKNSAVPVEAGLTITDFSQFNVTENRFTFSGLLSFRFDPKAVKLDIIDKFSFWRGEIDSKSEPTLYEEQGKTLAIYRIRVTFKTNLYYGFFPFEDHKIYIMLLNDKVNPGQLSFTSMHEDFIVAESVYVSGWRYYGHSVKDGFTSTDIGSPERRTVISHPAVLFHIDFFHNSARYVISIVLPLLIIFFIDLFSFCLDQREDHGVLAQISTANMVALVAYRFVVESLAPRVGYPMVADFLFFLFLTITLGVFIINAIGPYWSINQKKCVSVALQVIVLGVFTYVFTIWIPC